jgi:hypothetical protein
MAAAAGRAEARLVRTLRRRARQLRARVDPAAFDLRARAQPDEPAEAAPNAVALARAVVAGGPRRGAHPQC